MLIRNHKSRAAPHQEQKADADHTKRLGCEVRHEVLLTRNKPIGGLEKNFGQDEQDEQDLVRNCEFSGSKPGEGKPGRPRGRNQRETADCRS